MSGRNAPMQDLLKQWRRAAYLSIAVVLGIVSIGAQGPAPEPIGILRQVRTALAHGDVADAEQIAERGQGRAQDRELARALVEIFQGQDAAARDRLLPLAAADPLGEASLELGLLDLRTGRRDEALQRLMPFGDVRTFNGPDDYLRLARAARGTREFQLANDAFQRIADVPRPDIQSEWGDMFLEHHQPGDAVQSYTLALEQDARWMPALIGMARAFADENPKKAAEALASAEAQAPDYPDLLLATADLRLGNDDRAGAREVLDRLARVKPNTVDEAARRVVLAYKEGGVAAVESAMPAILASHPASGLSYRLAAEQATADYRFDDAAALAGRATALDAQDATAWFDLGLAQMRTGDEAAARTALETSWGLDKSAALTKNLLEVLDKIDTFEVVPHNDFIFKFAKEEAAIMKLYAIPLADEAWRQYVERYGFTPKGPIVVEVFPVHDDFAVRTVGLQGMTGALGACFGRVVTMDSPRARPPGDFSWQATLWHELGHVFSLQLSDYRVPRWLTEGISVYEEHRRNPAWGRELSLEFAHQFGKGKNFGVRKLPDAFKNVETLSFAYFESALLVQHLVDLRGQDGLRNLLLAYAGGAKDADAFATAFGLGVDDVEASFGAYLEKEFGRLRDAMRDPPSQVAADDLDGLKARAASAPDNYISQMSYARALIRAGDTESAKQPLERAAALAPEAQGDGNPRAELAAILAPTDPARARRLLRELLTYDHTNVVAARLLVKLAGEAKAADEEDFALQLVTDLDPFDAAAHSQLGARLMAKASYADALREFEAALAAGPANEAEAHTDIAEALLKLGRSADARREALAALKVAPTYARAQDALMAAAGAGGTNAR